VLVVKKGRMKAVVHLEQTHIYNMVLTSAKIENTRKRKRDVSFIFDDYYSTYSTAVKG
jgi:hypothetical protein